MLSKYLMLLWLLLLIWFWCVWVFYHNSNGIFEHIYVCVCLVMSTSVSSLTPVYFSVCVSVSIQAGVYVSVCCDYRYVHLCLCPRRWCVCHCAWMSARNRVNTAETKRARAQEDA